jgi:hypothetical protein
MVGERLVIGLVFELLGIDAQLTRRKLGKKIHPDHGGHPAPHGRYDDPAPAPSCSTIIEHDVRQVYVIKTRDFFFLLFISYSKVLHIVDAPRKNKRQIITLAPPLRASHSHPSLGRPPILLLEMDGGAPCDGWRRLRRKRRCETSVHASPSRYPPLPPLLVFDCCML